MKKLLYILLFVPLALFGQEDDPCYSINDYNLLTELNNPQIEINLVSGWNMIGYPCTQEIIVSDAFSSIVENISIVKDNNGSVYMPEYGFNGIGFLEGGQGYQIKMTEFVLGFTFCQSIQFPIIEGCTDCESSNFNQWANIDDGSCEYYYAIPDTAFLSWLQVNYPEVIVNDLLDVISTSTINDTILYIDYDDATNIQNLDGLQFLSNFKLIFINNQNNLSSIPDLSSLINLDGLFISYNDNLTSIPELPTNLSQLDISYNLSLTSFPDLSSLINLEYFMISGNGISTIPNLSGLVNLSSLQIFHSEAYIIPDLSGLINLDFLNFGGNLTVFPDLSALTNLNYLLIQSPSLLNIPDLSGLTNLSALVISTTQIDALTSISDLSGLINLSTLEIRHTDALISIPDLSALTNLSTLKINSNDALISIPDLSALTNLSTLEIRNNDNLECVEGYPEHINELTNYYPNSPYPIICENTYQVGDFVEGGIVFYVDETGQHGLVAALEDLTEGATDPYGWGYNGYEWGCYDDTVNGADGTSIGTGYQNTMDIVNQGCTTHNGGITAAQAALDAEINGYNDWYLPSKDELHEMYHTIGNAGPEGNIGGFEINWYWSSSETNNTNAWYVYFGSGASYTNSKSNPDRVRVIRAF